MVRESYKNRKYVFYRTYIKTHLHTDLKAIIKELKFQRESPPVSVLGFDISRKACVHQEGEQWGL